MSISRAVAAARASCRPIRGVLCDPNVPASYGVRSVSAITIEIAPSGSRSSSATACASDVRMFWPISVLPVYAVTRPCSSMCSQAARLDVSPRAWAPRPDSCANTEGMAATTTRPPPTTRRKSRRSSSNRYRCASLSSYRSGSIAYSWAGYRSAVSSVMGVGFMFMTPDPHFTFMT